MAAGAEAVASGECPVETGPEVAVVVARTSRAVHSMPMTFHLLSLSPSDQVERAVLEEHLLEMEVPVIHRHSEID